MKTENFSLPLSSSLQIFHTLTRVIRYDEGSGTGTPTIRVRSLSSGEMDVEMKPGRQIILPHAVDGIIITNLTPDPITGKITIGAGDVSDNSLVGTVTLDAATLAALESIIVSELQAVAPRPLGSSNFSSIANFAANTAIQIINPAANVNGAKVHWATMMAGASGALIGALLAKSGAAPTLVTDGHPVGVSANYHTAGSNPTTFSENAENILLPAGYGLYGICNAVAAGKLSASFTLL